MPRQIVNQPSDILELNRFLFEIRLSPETVSESETASFTQIIDDAALAVGADANVPIVPETASVVLSYRDAVLRNYISYFSDLFALDFIKNRNPIHYATNREAVAAGVFADALVVTPANEPVNDEASVGVLSARIDGGLPSNAVAIKIDYRRGLFQDSSRIADLRTLTILKARMIFDGTLSVPDHSRSAYERVLSKVRYEGALPESFARTGYA